MSDFASGSASATGDMGGGVSASAGASIGLSGASAGAEIDFGGGIGSLGISIDSNLKLIEMMMPINFVSFDYNPTTFKVQRVPKQKNRGRSGGGAGAIPGGTAPASQPSYLGANPLQIDFKALLSDEQGGLLDAIGDMTAIGGGVKARCDMMMNWVVGGPSTLLGMIVGMAASALGIGTQISMRPPILILQWGDPMRGFLLKGTMTKVICDYKRFDSIGNPIRAEVTCTFQEAQSNLLSLLTNPTSGGVSGRQRHTMTQGENLQAVAGTRYGRPGAWRQLAEANGIDDPQRVKPGQILTMPPPNEMQGG